MQLKTILLPLGSLVLAFFEPVSMLLLPILYLVIIDILTAMYVIRFYDKQPLTSRGFFKKLPQVLLFLVAVIAALHADPFFVTFGIAQFSAAKWVISFYGLYELFSILENLGRMGLPIAKPIAEFLSAKLPSQIKKEQDDK